MFPLMRTYWCTYKFLDIAESSSYPGGRNNLSTPETESFLLYDDRTFSNWDHLANNLLKHNYHGPMCIDMRTGLTCDPERMNAAHRGLEQTREKLEMVDFKWNGRNGRYENPNVYSEILEKMEFYKSAADNIFKVVEIWNGNPVPSPEETNETNAGLSGLAEPLFQVYSRMCEVDDYCAGYEAEDIKEVNDMNRERYDQIRGIIEGHIARHETGDFTGDKLILEFGVQGKGGPRPGWPNHSKVTYRYKFNHL